MGVSVKDFILVSPEMTAFVGRGALCQAPMPPDPVVFAFSGFDDDRTPIIVHRTTADFRDLEQAALIFVVSRDTGRRLFPSAPAAPGAWHMTSELRDLAMSILACEAQGEARVALRLARSIELFCRVHAALAEATLVPAQGDAALSEFDVARIAAARRMLDDGWQGKLTIAELARRCGINRDKLIRGFRHAYGSTIAEALSERRLGEARTLLLTSDLPVSSVGYRCGYMNNASFTRAFSRRYGIVPSALRRMGIAA